MGPKANKVPEKPAPPKDSIEVIVVKIVIENIILTVTVNIICRTDIAVDYIRRNLVKQMQGKLAADGELEKDSEFKLSELTVTKLREYSAILTNISAHDIVLRDETNADVDFKDDLSKPMSSRVVPLSNYCIGHYGQDEEHNVVILQEISTTSDQNGP